MAKIHLALFIAVVASVAVLEADAGFRCSIGNWFCRTSCVVSFHDSGKAEIFPLFAFLALYFHYIFKLYICHAGL